MLESHKILFRRATQNWIHIMLSQFKSLQNNTNSIAFKFADEQLPTKKKRINVGLVFLNYLRRFVHRAC